VTANSAGFDWAAVRPSASALASLSSVLARPLPVPVLAPRRAQSSPIPAEAAEEAAVVLEVAEIGQRRGGGTE
jgi:hypothetical protein